MDQHPIKRLRHVIITGRAGFMGSLISTCQFLDMVKSTVSLERESFVRSMA